MWLSSLLFGSEGLLVAKEVVEHKDSIMNTLQNTYNTKFNFLEQKTHMSSAKLVRRLSNLSTR